jgi:inhibitor of KinA sporulation pathway (predicted exonuclease)
MRVANEYYMIVDLEATCSDNGTVPRHEMEIIEIGAVMLSSRTFEIESEFQILVRPVRHPNLPRFCVELTGITQRQVAGGSPFPEALEMMMEWKHPFADSIFCSWGDYDRNQFLRDCEYHRITYPFGAEHLNLKEKFADVFGGRKGLGISEAMRHLGLKFTGSQHRGLDDARNIAHLIQRACAGG